MILHDSLSTLHRALDASAIEASCLATQASGVEVGHFVDGTAGRSKAGGHQALHGLVLLAAAGGEIVAIAPAILWFAVHGAQHVLQLGEVARQDLGTNSGQRAGGAFAVLGQLLGGGAFAACAGFAGERKVGRGLVRHVVADYLGGVRGHDKISI